jgi:hypothetical protein
MLFDQPTLQGIADGSITLAFRRWRRPSAKAGSSTRTAIGVVATESVGEVDPAEITEAEARQAGYAGLAQLRARLDRDGREGQVYRIGLRFAGADPRVALRQAEPQERELAELRARLSAMDRRSAGGPWTWQVLRMIEANEGVRAPDLAARFGRETQKFKVDVRKLKELGLTESLLVGYRISARGRALLATNDSTSGSAEPRA